MPPPDAPEAPAWLAAMPDARVVSGVPRAATDVVQDSRRAAPGAVFVAIPGFTVDGNAYIPRALEAGAEAVIVQADREAAWRPHVGDRACFVAVPDARSALAQAAAGCHGHPAGSLGVVGVTGTDGKTTTCHLIAHVLTATGRPSGLLTSVAFTAGGQTELNATHMTTVEADEVQRRLARIRDAGDRYAAIEASSIGLVVHRVDECAFDVAVFTNLTQDHLDFHGTMDAYRDAKATLFRMLGDGAPKPGIEKAAIVNADDSASAAMLDAAPPKARCIRYGVSGDGDLIASDITTGSAGTEFVVRSGGERMRARSPLFGDFNVANGLAAVAVAVSQGAALGDALEALATFPGVPGRMESIDAGQPFRVIVDIASTEQAMRNVLRVLRPATNGRIIVVFGAAGERDVERRSGIARAVAAGADYAVIANEDPRGEDPDAIIGHIAAALSAAGWREADRFERCADRREAIARAFGRAEPGDTVLLAGKATEPSIVIGPVHHPWDERAVARKLLAGRGGGV